MTMHLTELKQKPVSELMDMAREMSIDNVGRSRKQEVIAAIVRKQAKSGEDIYGAVSYTHLTLPTIYSV